MSAHKRGTDGLTAEDRLMQTHARCIPHHASHVNILQGLQRRRRLMELAEDHALGGDEVGLAVLKVLELAHVILRGTMTKPWRAATSNWRKLIGIRARTDLDLLRIGLLGYHDEKPRSWRYVVRIR